MALYLGVDPGAAGALALWRPDARTLEIHDMPVLHIRKGRALRTVMNEHAFAEILRKKAQWIDHAYIENVHAMPHQGVTSMFSFGAAFGIVRGALAALDVPFTLIDPARWMRALDVPKGPDAARQRIVQLMPEHAAHFSLRKHDGRADAALLAYLLGTI